MEYIVTIIFCCSMLSIILLKLFIDEEEYKSLKEKKWKLFIFKDGTQQLSRGFSPRELKHAMEEHGELIEVIEDNDDIKQLNEIEKENKNG